MSKLLLDEKCKEMISYGYIALRQLPKNERHVLSAEIRLSMLKVQRLIITAFKRYHKKTTLTDLDIELAVLKRQIRLAKELHYIDLKKYKIWVSLIIELGRMVGGWIRSVNNRQAVAL